MGLYINTNINSMIAQNSLTKSTNGLQKAILRLTTGLKVNQSGDDAAGLCVAQRLNTQIKGNKRAMMNVQDGINTLYIVEGGMDAATEDLQRIRELCLQAANGIYSAPQQQTMLEEIKQRLYNIDVIANSTMFNGIQLTNGSEAKLILQSGSGSKPGDNTIDITSSLTDLNVSSLGICLNIVSVKDAVSDLPEGYTADCTKAEDDGAPKVNGVNWTGDSIREYIDRIDEAIDRVAQCRAQIGAFENRLESATANMTTMNENYNRSYSQIMDTDMAEESANMVKYQVLQQTSAAMLAQANQIPAIALQLLNT